jgi:disulfide bond formation protein DsbB
MSPQLARSLNVLFVLAVSLILLAAFGVQFAKGELPCPLCLLQRLAMLGVGAGALLNVRYGVRPRHYGFALASAIFGGAVAGRQVLLHIAPGDPGYGEPLLGWHLYTWSFVAFASIGIKCDVVVR